jgi:ATP-dependent Clp protease protease subunit
MFDPLDGPPPSLAGLPGLPGPLAQRSRDYQWQRNYTIGELLLENRIVFFGFFGNSYFADQFGQHSISDVSANFTIQQLLLLRHQNRNQEIHLYINSPGGSVTATLAIYDTMQFLECPISTYCMGMAASGAAILLAAGSKGRRYALPHAKVMIHQPWSQGMSGQASDVEIEMREILKEKRRLNEILSNHTGRSIEQIEAETERNRYFSAQEAKEFGLVDEVLVKIADEKSEKKEGSGPR